MDAQTTKACTACGGAKPMESFYRHPAGADGRMSLCKECHKAAVRANRAAKADYYAEYDRQRAFREDRVAARKAYQEAMKECPEFRARQTTRAKAWRDRHVVKRRAHIMAGNAIRDGLLVRPDQCERCHEDKPLHAHHENYYRPLEVTWLCVDCHGLRHREINEEIRNGANYRIRGFE